jgi:hypothetical protein
MLMLCVQQGYQEKHITRLEQNFVSHIVTSDFLHYSEPHMLATNEAHKIISDKTTKLFQFQDSQVDLKPLD